MKRRKQLFLDLTLLFITLCTRSFQKFFFLSNCNTLFVSTNICENFLNVTFNFLSHGSSYWHISIRWRNFANNEEKQSKNFNRVSVSVSFVFSFIPTLFREPCLFPEWKLRYLFIQNFFVRWSSKGFWSKNRFKILDKCNTRVSMFNNIWLNITVIG